MLLKCTLVGESLEQSQGVWLLGGRASSLKIQGLGKGTLGNGDFVLRKGAGHFACTFRFISIFQP